MSGLTLTGQRALITGASSGIGQATACAFARAGAAVIVNYLSDDQEARQMVEDIRRDGSTVYAVQGDVSTEEGCETLFAQAMEKLGGIDILIANAGVQSDAAFTAMSLEDWRKVIDVNLTGQFLCAKAAVEQFRRQGLDTQRSRALGKILFTSSVHQAIPWAGHANYAAAKGGLKLLMQNMAQELAPEKIRINAIAPGAIKTSINTEAWGSKEARRELLELIPYGRVGEPEDVARAALWLVSDESDYVVGTTLFIDGGMVLYPSFREGG